MVEQSPTITLADLAQSLARIERALSVRVERRLLSRRQAAKMLGVDRGRLGRWVKEGRLREVQLDGAARIPMAEIERLELEGVPQVAAGGKRRVGRPRKTAEPAQTGAERLAAVRARLRSC